MTGIDLTVMTGNVAQVITDQREWATALRTIRSALRPGGYLVFETRNPAARGWERWTREASLRTTELPGIGSVTSWVAVATIDWPLVSFRWTWSFASDGAMLTSDSTVRFRERGEVSASRTVKPRAGRTRSLKPSNDSGG